MKTTKEKIEVMQAFAEGEKIWFVELDSETVPAPYKEVLEPTWNWAVNDYFLKPPTPEVDWVKIPENTPVLVRHRLDSFWAKRYFKKYAEGEFEVFGCGSTSRFITGVEKWKYAKLDPEASSLMYWIPNTGTEPTIAGNEVCIVKFKGGSINPYSKGLDWRLINTIASYAIIKP